MLKYFKKYFSQRTLDVLFDYVILITSLLTLLFVILAIVPLMIALPNYWLRPFLELILLGYFGLRGLSLWRKEVH